MKKSHLSCSIHTVLFTFIAASANAAFIGRLETAPGSGVFQAYYDDQLDITWATNANINGAAKWDDQVSWVTSLGIGGVGSWRLPNMDINDDGTVAVCSSSDTQASCQDNEYGHLYRYGAGTTWGGGVRFGLPGPFSNIQPFSYWSNTLVAPVDAWSFALSNGTQEHYWTENIFFAWAVSDGDVTPKEPDCDFDEDGSCDVTDLDLMQALGPLVAGVDASGNESFDLDGNGTIDLTDRDQWLTDAATVNGFASAYKLGDANIDGVVDGQDFIAWNGSEVHKQFALVGWRLQRRRRC